MRLLVRLALLPVCLLISCLYAGIFGMLHNQISYTISPDYFHGFKFRQFDIPEALQNRLGASLVGWYASWWMGLPLGMIQFLVGLIHPQTDRFLINYVKTANLMIVVTFAFSLLGILVGLWVAGGMEDYLPVRMRKYWFWVCGTMHDFTYLGGAVALFVGAAYQVRLRRADQHKAVLNQGQGPSPEPR